MIFKPTEYSNLSTGSLFCYRFSLNFIFQNDWNTSYNKLSKISLVGAGQGISGTEPRSHWWEARTNLLASRTHFCAFSWDVDLGRYFCYLLILFNFMFMPDHSCYPEDLLINVYFTEKNGHRCYLFSVSVNQ